MPYKLIRLNNKCYSVKNTITGKLHSKCSTLKNAEKQLRLLNYIERK